MDRAIALPLNEQGFFGDLAVRTILSPQSFMGHDRYRSCPYGLLM